jgi:hypothetical protein
MRLLPGERNKRINEAVEDFRHDGQFRITEPCDCGSMIRHNNSGNYHEIIDLANDSGRIFVRYDSTSEFEPRPEWEDITEEEVLGIIEKHADWL